MVAVRESWVAFHCTSKGGETRKHVRPLNTGHFVGQACYWRPLSPSICLFIQRTINGSQRRKESMTWYLYLYQVVCIGLSGSQDYIHIQCAHQEMPGKCFNLPTLIQNARTLNQAAQSKYSTCFLAWPPQWVCTALSLFLFSEALWHWPHIAAYIAGILSRSTSPRQHMSVKYLLHTFSNEKHISTVL